MITRYEQWQPWFAWRPVRLRNQKIIWLKRIYRRAEMKTYATMDDWTRYQYGDMFDVLGS